MSNDKYCDCYGLMVVDCTCATMPSKRITQCLCRKEPLTSMCGTGNCNWKGAEHLMDKPYVGVTKGFKEEIQEWRDNLSDEIYNPEHYNHGFIECIDYIEGGLSREAFEGYLEGNIKKYLHRWRFKGKDKDLQKARWFLNKLIEFREEGA